MKNYLIYFSIVSLLSFTAIGQEETRSSTEKASEHKKKQKSLLEKRQEKARHNQEEKWDALSELTKKRVHKDSKRE